MQVLLKGNDLEELKKIKDVMQYAVFAAYHLSLETSFLEDEGASLPKIPMKAPFSLPENVHNVDGATSLSANSVISSFENVNAAFGSHTSFNKVSPLPSLDFPSEYGVMINSNSEFEECESASGSYSFSPADIISGKVYGFSRPEWGSFRKVFPHVEGSSGGSGPSADAQHASTATASGDYFSSTENNQSILVSLSSRCILKGTVCERSQLLRITFYGNFDKPLGRFLRDDLFDQVGISYICFSLIVGLDLCWPKV